MKLRLYAGWVCNKAGRFLPPVPVMLLWNPILKRGGCNETRRCLA
jgi:hypothetical protein